MRKWKIVVIFLCLVGLAQPVLRAQLPGRASFRTPFSQVLESRLQAYPDVPTTPGMSRLRAMQFYFPANEIAEEKSLFQKLFGGRIAREEHEKAVAFFLFNMYITTAAYQEDMPTRLTLDYLGALDGFSKCHEKLDLEHVQEFYSRHRAAIKEHLSSFFKQENLPAYDESSILNDWRERKFLQLLSQAPARDFWPGYAWPGATRLRAKPNGMEEALLTRLLKRSLESGQNKVITFSRPDVEWEDWDNKLVRHNRGEIRTYRCVNDECAYCSYLFGKQMCEIIDSSSRNWGLMRLYKITAYPTREKFLLPQSGERFTLADGEQAPPWYYHTATLAIMNLDGAFTPLVVDSFLAGERPMLLAQWAQLFRADETFFQVDVFERSKLMESAIVEPALWRGANVVVDGKEYMPHQILE